MDLSWLLLCHLVLQLGHWGHTEAKTSRSGATSTKPNIVFIMADDLGWGNVGYHNEPNAKEINTPVIDQLVAEGLELDRHYVYSSCSPSRASFQSGRLPVHCSKSNGDGLLDPTHGIPSEFTTFATKLQEGGYDTHLVGKWDVGFNTWSKLPINQGYSSFYGYLGKGVEYFTKSGDDMCNGVDLIDFWEDDHPLEASMDDVDRDKYIEFMFEERVQDILTRYGEAEEGEDSAPFFLFYSMHLPHYPAEIPARYLEVLDNDTDECAELTTNSYPQFADQSLGCRSIVQSQVNLMDAIVGGVVNNLKNSGLWEDTLLIFSSDNGGSLELSLTAANNWPLRGGKSSMFEGGVRSVAFVSGGYLPAARRGQKEEGLVHLADWYTTFASLAGVDEHDAAAEAAGLPAVDGLDLWPLISGEVAESPRTEIIVGPHVLIQGRYKIHLHQSIYAVWQQPQWPTTFTPSEDELREMVLDCSSDSPCLFDIFEDPAETTNLAEELPDLVQAMKNKMSGDDFWFNEEEGVDSCPDDLDTDELDCGCWMAMNNWNSFAGPYQNLTAEHIYFEEDIEVISSPLHYWRLRNPDSEIPDDMLERERWFHPDFLPDAVGEEQRLSVSLSVSGNVSYLGLELKYYVLVLVASLMGCVLVVVFVRYFQEMGTRIASMRRPAAKSTDYGAL